MYNNADSLIIQCLSVI